jgi:type III secretion protein Q
MNASQPVSDLPSIAPAGAAMASVFSYHRILPPVAAMPVQIVPPPRDCDGYLTLHAECPAGRLRILAPPALADALLQSLAPEARLAVDPWRGLLLELALEAALDRLASHDPELDIRLGTGPAPEPPTVTFGIDVGGMRVHVEADTGAGRRIAHRLAAIPPLRVRLPGLTLCLHARVLAATLPLAELRSINPGDAIIATGWADGNVRLVAGEILAWPARHSGTKLSVTGPRYDARRELERLWMQDNSLPLMSGENLDDLPIRLSFELGTVELPLADVEALGPGYVFELGRKEGEAVDIMVNGRRIGAGRIILVGETVAVQVTRISGK